MGCGNSTPVVEINGETGANDYVEKVKTNGELIVNGEEIPGTVSNDNPLDNPLDPLPPIKEVTKPLEDAVGKRPKTSNPNFREPMKLPKLISNGVAAKYQPESGETLEEAPEEEEEDNTINKDEIQSKENHIHGDGEDGTDADDEAEVTDVRKDNKDVTHDNNEEQLNTEDQKDPETPAEPKMATNCNRPISDLENVAGTDEKVTDEQSEIDTGIDKAQANGDTDENHLEAPTGAALVSGSRLSVRGDDRAGSSLSVQAPSRSGSSLSVSNNKAPSRAGSKLSIKDDKAPSRAGSKLSIKEDKAPSRAGSSLSVRDDKATSRAGSSLSLNVPSGGGSRASSSHSHRDGGHSARSQKNGGDTTARSAASVKSEKSHKSTSKRSSIAVEPDSSTVATEVINKMNSTAEVAG